MNAELEGRDAQQRDASESSSRRRRRARRELSPQQLRARRERRKGWMIPFGSLFGVVGAYVTFVLVTGAGTHAVEPPTPDEVSAAGTTQFGEAGLAYVREWRIVHVNLEHGPLTADDVGLDDDATAVADAPPGQVWAMVVGMDQGGPAGDGAIRLVVDSVSVTTEGGMVTSLDVARAPYVWASYPTVMNDLQQGVAAFGWQFDPEVRAEIDDIVGDAVRAGEAVTVAVEPGMVTGVEVGAEIVCRDDGRRSRRRPRRPSPCLARPQPSRPLRHHLRARSLGDGDDDMTVLAPPRPPRAAEVRRGLSAPERRTRRRFVVRWVSIGVGLLLVAATPIVTSILASHALQEASAPPSLAEVSRLGQTQMTPAGMAYAQLHSQASFNLLHLPQPASELGMQENATVVLEPSAGGIQTTVVGPAGGVEAWASSITATTERGDWVRLEVTEDALGFGDFTRLMQRVDVLAQMLDWRWSDRLADAAASAVAEGVRTGETTLVQVDGSDAFGMTTSGRIECTAEGACTLTTVFEVG